ncbi:MAG: hypothetical protein IT377_03070 [Polyangiaceae bacterium]|nr:hypothetical protein [Polyangiaceae bacterium]
MKALVVLCSLTVGGLLVAACGGSDTGDLFGSGGTGTGGSSGGGTSGGGTSGGGTSGGGTSGGGTAGSGGSLGGATGGGGAPTGGGGGPSGGGTGGGVGGATGGSGGGTVGPENCTNGVDDNGDGQADCADPKCTAGYTCAAAAPTGWSGIGYVDAKLGTACPDGFSPATSLYDAATLAAQKASCTCGCNTPSNVLCRAQLQCNSGGSCSGGTGTSVYGNCSTIPTPNPGSTNSCKVSELAASGGQCAASVKALAPPVAWSASARSCTQPTVGACTNTAEVCVQKLAGAKGPCISHPGDVACPAPGPYSQKTVYFDGKVNDTRGCSTSGCSCGAPSGGTCACSASTCGVVVMGPNNCSGTSGLALVPVTGQCTTFTDTGNGDSNWGVFRTGTSVTSPGACSPSGGGTPTGSVEPSGAITVCCTP